MPFVLTLKTVVITVKDTIPGQNRLLKNLHIEESTENQVKHNTRQSRTFSSLWATEHNGS